MKEHAFFMYKDNPIIELFFNNGRLVNHKVLDYVAPISHINWVKDLTTKELESKLLKRRESYVFPGSMYRYYYKNSYSSPYKDMKDCRGVSRHDDDDCWIKYDYDDFNYEELLIKLIPPAFRTST